MGVLQDNRLSLCWQEGFFGIEVSGRSLFDSWDFDGFCHFFCSYTTNWSLGGIKTELDRATMGTLPDEIAAGFDSKKWMASPGKKRISISL